MAAVVSCVKFGEFGHMHKPMKPDCNKAVIKNKIKAHLQKGTWAITGASVNYV